MNEHEDQANSDTAEVPGDVVPGADGERVEAVSRTREEPEMIERVLLDGSTTPMQVHRPVGKPKAIVVFFPGFGMGSRYYWPMAQELRDRGYGVLVSELHGQGGQTARATRRQIGRAHV